MTLKNIVGIDHAVVIVRELDRAAENWKRLGFTVSPRGTHSPHMGTGNYTIMLDPDYIELLGVLTPKNAASRADICAPIGRTANGELVYSMKCDTIPPPPQARIEETAPPPAPPPQQETQRSGIFGWSYDHRPTDQ